MFIRKFIMVLGLLFSCFANAEYAVEAKGKLLFPTGTQTDLDFGFSLKKSGYDYMFKAGQQEMAVAQPPEKYSIWISLGKEGTVYVQEFASNYIQEFEWQPGEHNIALKKKILKPKRAPGDYVLTIDDIDYFFLGKQGQIDILFDSDGISAIEASGFVKDIGMSE